jgi:hypothetical protein
MSCEEKRLYITEREAILGLLKVKKIHGKRQRTYQCNKCKGWHLTSRLLHWQSPDDLGTDITKQDWLD